MNLILLTTFILSKTQQVYVILGGSSATNINKVNYTGTNKDVVSYHNGEWEMAINPMPGGDGNGGSPWPHLGNNLNKKLKEKIYFVDCAKNDAIINDWKEDGKYYQLSQECFRIAEKINSNYNVIWQEGGMDNEYSYNSDFFYNTINNLIRPNTSWYLSIETLNNYFRRSKLQDIYYMTNSIENVYMGANLDSICEVFPYDNKTTYIISNLWEKKLMEKTKINSIEEIYMDCININNFVLFLVIGFIFLIFLFGFYYQIKFYKKRNEYQLLINN